MLSTGHHKDISNDEIMRYCSQPDCAHIGGSRAGNLVVRISKEAVVKFGLGVTQQEADNQQAAFELLDPTIVRVPKVYRFFAKIPDANSHYPSTGYLVMEYVAGTALKEIDQTHIAQISRALTYFSTIQSHVPGHLRGGSSCGLLWSESGEPTFKTVSGMEKWLNFRLPGQDVKLDFQSYPLVLCHLDIAPRNIIWSEGSPICLLDWSTAGFYPRFFEICVLMINEHSNGDFETLLMASLEQLSDQETEQVWLLIRSFQNGQRYHFSYPQSD